MRGLRNGLVTVDAHRMISACRGPLSYKKRRKMQINSKKYGLIQKIRIKADFIFWVDVLQSACVWKREGVVCRDRDIFCMVGGVVWLMAHALSNVITFDEITIGSHSANSKS